MITSTGASVDWAALAQEPERCIVCSSTEAVSLYAPTFRGSLADAPDFFLAHRKATAHGPIRKCCRCGFVYTSPRFASRDYDTIYASIPTPHEGVRSFDAAKSARFQRLAKIVRRYVSTGAPLLDFGCGDGGFLRQIADPAAKGFEIGPPGRSEAGPSEIFMGDWAQTVGLADGSLGEFAVVTAFDVLEHLPRIEEDVALIRSVLKPGGIFFASVPNIASVVARVMGSRWNMILLEHLWYFSPATFDTFLARFGFERVAMWGVPFDAPVAHVVTRIAQTLGMRGAFVPQGISRLVVPAPAGIMLGAYRAI